MSIRVGCYPADDGGCGWYRMRYPALALQAQGADVEILEGLQGVWVDDPTGPQLVDMLAPPVDVVVLQRPLTRQLSQAVPFLQAKGIAVVVEIDDAFDVVPAHNPAWGEIHPKVSPDRNVRWLAEAVRACDLLTVSTPTLAARYRAFGPKVRVLRNLIPERYLSVPKPPRGKWLVVGWAGTPSTHTGDLEVCRSSVATAVTECDAMFGAIGSESTARILGIPPERAFWQPWTTIEDYPATLASLDVGIAPLLDTAFARAKSWLKPLEYGAVGVPAVVSPLPEYATLAKVGIGVLARNPRAWRRELSRLLTDDAWRAELAERGKAAAASLTYKRGCGEWWNAWEAAYDRRRAMSQRKALR